MTEKLTITRTWKPVTKTVEHCHECPWFHAEYEGNATLLLCENPRFNEGKGGYAAIIGDITMWHPNGISKHCPERLKPQGNIDSSAPCGICGHVNTFPWLVCENPNCGEVIALQAQRRKNRI